MSGKPWSAQDVQRLRKMAVRGIRGAVIAQRLKRSRMAVYSRLAIERVGIKSRFALRAESSSLMRPPRH